MRHIHKLHEGEVDVSESLVRRLITAQFPRWADLPLGEVRSTGTVNAIFRLGDELYVRLPRQEASVEDLDRELQWLPKLSPHLSLKIPDPVTEGQPTREYPFPWAIYRWISGQPYAGDLIEDERRAANDLARFIGELRKIEPSDDAPRAGREPLHLLDSETRKAIESSRDVIDVESAMIAWERALRAPIWDGRDPVWIHADLLRPNLLVGQGRINAVIDFGSSGIGDPAADIIPAWAVFDAAGRDEFRSVLDVDDGTWERARGFALHQAAMIIPYYRHSNPDFVSLAKRTVEQILTDLETKT